MTSSASLDRQLERWVEARLISPAQADAIRANEAGPVPTPAATERSALVMEAVGYLGGTVILVAGGLLVAEVWSGLSPGVRVLLAAAAALALMVVGLAIPRRGPGLRGARLRLVAVLLALSVAAVAATLALLGHQVVGLSGRDTALLVTAGAAVVGLALWWLRPSLLQQVAAVVPVLATGGVLVGRWTDDPRSPGLAVWVLALVWFVLGWRGVLPPRRVVRLLAGAAMLVGAVLTLGSDAGIALGLLTVAGLVGAAVRGRDPWLLAVAAAGVLLFLPPAVSTWFAGSLVVPLVLLVVGAGLLVTALRLLRGADRRG